MKVGVIGAGYWGKKHVDEYTKLGHEVYVSDLTDKNLNFCKVNYNSNIVNNYIEILNNHEIEAVSICTPNSTHYKFAIECLEFGKHILLEKPLALNSLDAEKIIKKSEMMDRILLVGHIFRFNNAIKKIKELIYSKVLGQIYTIDLFWNNLEPVFYDRDILFDLGVHPIDILDNIFEQIPKNISCVGRGFRQKESEFAMINYNLIDNFSGKNIEVNIHLSWLNPIKQRNMIIVGSEKTAIVECVKQTIQLINNKSEIIEDINIDPNNTIRDELKFFLSSINNKIKIESTIPDGKIAKRIVSLIEKANISLINNEQL